MLESEIIRNYQANKAGIPSRIFPVTVAGLHEIPDAKPMKIMPPHFGHSAAF
jgi:hypothetical protein